MKQSLLLIFLIIAFTLSANTLQMNYQFDNPEITVTGEYLKLDYQDLLNSGREGEPLLPYLAGSLLLPPGTEIEEINIISSQYYPDLLTGAIQPAGRQFPLSSEFDFDYQVVPDKDVYSSSNPYQDNPVTLTGTHFMNGHSIGNFTICPVKYIPGKNEITLLREITLEIKTHSTQRAASALNFLRSDQLIQKRLAKITDNPEDTSSYLYPAPQRDESYDLLLITNSALHPAFSDYLAFKEGQGFAVTTMTTELIYNNYAGQDDQERIRNCIIDFYQNTGISYVILGGDSAPNNASHNIIPHRGFYVSAYSTPDSDIPADMYYSNLDGTWNDDNDNYWGEAGEDDLYSELSIGRICVDSALEIENFTNKLMMYQDSPVLDDIEKALMVGELLWSSSNTWAKPYKEEVANGSSNHGYTTVGISDNFTVSTLYEMDGNWEAPDIFNQFNNVGINLLNHLGHSFTDYNMKMYVSSVNTNNFQNDGIERGFVIGYSQGCYNGAFDNRNTGAGNYFTEDCFSEAITTIATAEVANIGNSRYGWGQHGSTDGASQYFDRQFFDAIFGEDISIIGDANADSKEDNVAYINSHEGAIRWCMYELNLFGDPTMDIWTALPEPMIVNYPASVPIGSSLINFQTDTPSARIGLSQNGELVGRAVADESGIAQLELFEPLSDAQPLALSVIGHNKERFTGTIFVVSDQPYVIFNQYQIGDESGNNNGQADYQETIQLDMTLNNVGNQPANNVVATISTEDEYVIITDSQENYGTIPAESIVTSEDAFSIEVAAYVPDQHNVNFQMEVSGDRDIWLSNFNIVLNAPLLSCENPIINDSTGDNDGILDPGETAQISFLIINSGHADSPQVTAALNCNEPGITIETDATELGAIAAGESAEAIFTVSADAEMNIGTVVNLELDVQASSYSFTDISTITVGLCIEDFESGDFSSYPWQHSGDSNWIISSESYQGAYCTRSGNIGDNQSSSLLIDLYVMTASEISFWSKISSESNYDYLKFYIDGALQDSWSGSIGWTEHTYSVSSGEHTFKWEYTKDGMVSTGSDCAWVDYIILPPNALGATATLNGNITTNPPAAYENTIITAGEYTLNPDETGFYTIVLPYGIYDVSASLQGYETTVVEDVELLPYETVVLDFYLPYIAPPLGLTAELTDDIVNLTWLEPERFLTGEKNPEKTRNSSARDERSLLYYKIYRSQNEEDFIFLYATTQETYQDILPAQGNFAYYVTGIYSGNSESDPSNIAYVEYTSAPENELPAATRLWGNYPNPFNPATRISFSLKEPGLVELTIFNLKGEKIISLCHEEMPAGNHSIIWDGANSDNEQMPTGIYLYELKTAFYRSLKKMMLIK